MKTISIYLFFTLFFTSSFNSFSQTSSDFSCHISESSIRHLYQDKKGFIWAVSPNILNRYDGTTWESILPAQNQSEVLSDIRDVAQDNNGNYWFALGDDGVRLYMVQEHQIINSDSYNGRRYTATGVFPTLDYRVFVTTPNGLLTLEEKGEINRLKSNYYSDTQSHNKYLTKVINDYERTTVWMSGKEGLWSKAYLKDSLIYHSNDQLKDPEIFKIDKHDNYIIAATRYHAIQVYDLVSESWVSVDNQSTIKEAALDLAKLDDHRWLVLGEEKERLGIFDVEERTMMDYNSISLNEIDDAQSILLDDHGLLWIGHGAGVCSFKLHAAHETDGTTNVYIRQIEIEGEKINSIFKFWDNQQVILTPSQENIRILYNTINTARDTTLNYQYKLEGIDTHWVNAGKNKDVTYSIKEKGAYTFRVRQLRQDGSYNVSDPLIIEKKTIQLINRSRLYGILGLTILGLGGLFALYWLYDKKKTARREEELQRSIGDLQNLALRSQMNPHFIFNSLNSIRYFIVSNDNQKAADYLTKFSRLIRLILENSKADFIPLEDEILTLKLYMEMEQIRFDNKFDFKIYTNGIAEVAKVIIPPMIIQPFAENAILHGIHPKEGRSHVSIDISLLDSKFVITIVDDGIGREASEKMKANSSLKKESLGMKITERRLQLLKNSMDKEFEVIDLYDINGEASGTKVVIRFDLPNTDKTIEQSDDGKST